MPSLFEGDGGPEIHAADPIGRTRESLAEDAVWFIFEREIVEDLALGILPLEVITIAREALALPGESLGDTRERLRQSRQGQGRDKGR